MGFIRDPLWDTLIGIVFTIVIAFIVYWLQRNQKRISYSMVSMTSILGNEVQKTQPELKLLYNNKFIEEGYLVVLYIYNSGNMPVATADYEHPITFSFNDEAKLLDATVLETEPISLKDEVSLKREAGKLILNPLLLNRKDNIKLRLLIDHFNGEINAKARIVGLQYITKRDVLLDDTFSIYTSMNATASTIIIIPLILTLLLLIVFRASIDVIVFLSFIIWIFFVEICLILLVMILNRQESTISDQIKRFFKLIHF